MMKKKPSNRKLKSKQRRVSIGKEYIFISYVFVAIFVALIGYMAYFQIRLSNEFENSTYNTRINTAEDKIIRGPILASGGEILAETETDEDGNETRVYPYGRVFAHVVGYTAKGKTGIESTSNFSLLTSNAVIAEQIYNDFRDQKNQGDSVVTTLDVDLQQAAYDSLGDYKGAIVVMDPETGKILASVSKPDYDPNDIAETYDDMISDDSNTNLLNRVTSGLYPPGSTFKIVTALAYYRQNPEAVEDFSYDCTGELTSGNFTIHCYAGESHGEEDFTDIFAESCNTGFASVGLKLSYKKFKGTAEKLLFNTDYGENMDFTYRASSFKLKKTDGGPLIMQTAIGQGDTTVTPIHMAMIVSAIANDGDLMKPYLVDHVENDTGSVITKNSPELYKTLMTKNQARFLQKLMRAVVTEGTASSLNTSSYDAYGKTGTADYTDEEAEPHSWFVGYAEKDGKKVVVSIVVEGGGQGSKMAVPAAKTIFDTYFNES